MTNTATALKDAGRHGKVAPWPAADLERVTHCPVCGSAGRTVLHEGLTDRVFFCAPGVWSLYTCGGCGSAYLDPRPTPASIGRAYGNYFTHAGNEPEPIGNLSMPRRLRRAVANGYRNWRFGTHLRPATGLGVLAAWLLPSLREVLVTEFRHIPKAFPGSTLLDIGAGNGDFLNLARSAGWTVAGVEPDVKAVGICSARGLDVKEGGIEQLDGDHAHFDFITINHVIEHVHDPQYVLRRAFELLKPGGCLYLDTPNINAYGHKRFGSCYLHLDPPRHLVLFNWVSLERLLRQLGYSHITRLPQKGIYKKSAASSLAISGGCDPIIASPSLHDHIIGYTIAMRTLLSHRRIEFVTLLAYKPENHGV